MAAEEISFPQRAAAWPARLKDYVEGLQMEMRKVTWPSWKQVRGTTAVVIASVFLFSAYFFVVDNIISRVINKLFDAFTK
jgi:preprotein translocase subunit SecE